jgi:predicted esterase
MDDVHPQGLKTIPVEATVHGRVLVRETTRADARGVLLGFHGYMENAAVQLDRLAHIPGNGAWTLAAVQALNRFYRGRTHDVVASWMTREDREQMIVDNIRYVDAAVAALGAATRIEELPVVCVGFSQGAAMAFRAGVRCRFRRAGIVSVGADVPPDVLGDATAQVPSLLFARGARDEWLTADVFNRNLDALRQRGVDVRPLVYDGAHEWNDAVTHAIGEFIDSFAP